MFQRFGDRLPPLAGMRANIIAPAVLLAAVVAIGAMGKIHVSVPGHAATRVFSYSSKELESALVSNFAFSGDLQSVRRNSLGTGLRFLGVIKPSGEVFVMTLSSLGRRMTKAPGRIAYLNDQDDVVAWTDDVKQGINFASGYLLRLPKYGLFDVDPSGKHFVIGEKPSSTWIGEVDRPGDRVCLSTNLLATRVFEQAGQLLVFGAIYEIRRGKTNRLTACLIIEKDKGGYRVQKQLSFPWSGGVIDIDPHTGRFLLENDSDMFPRWFVFDAKSGKKSKSEIATEAGFFLTEDILNKVKRPFGSVLTN